MKTSFENQTLEKLNIVLKLLERTVNNEGSFEVQVKELNTQKIKTTYNREDYLVAAIETSIAGIKESIETIEERKKIKQQMSLLSSSATNVRKRS